MENKIAQQNIPEGWKFVKLKEISMKIGSGVTPRGGSEVYTKEGIIFLRSQNIQNGYLSLADVEYISDEIDNRMSNSKVEKNDILYNITGASIGRSALYTLDDKANVNQHVCIIRLKNEDPRFVNYFLRSSLGGKQLDSFQAGGNRQGLNYNQLGSFKFLLPRKAEQDRIVVVLETWDQAIEKLKRKIEVKKEIKKGLMQELLIGKTRLDGFKDDWHMVRLGEVSSLTKGKDLSKNDLDPNGKYEAIHYGELFTKYNEQIEFVRSRTDKYENPFLSKEGDVLMPTSDVTPRGLSTASCITKGGVILGSDILVVRPNIKRLDGLFFSFFVSSHRKHVMRLVSGTTVFHLYGSGLAKLNLSLPSVEEQKKITKILITANKDIEKLEQKLSLLKDQKKYLLNNLVTGAIRTPESLSIHK